MWESKTSCENSQSLDKQMGDAMNLIVNDKKEGHTLNTLMTSNSLFFSTDRDRLFYTVYEKSSLPSSSLLPHLWTYRSRINLEHLFQTLQAQKMKDTCPILHEFLKEVSDPVHFVQYAWSYHSLSRSPYYEPHVIFLN